MPPSLSSSMGTLVLRFLIPYCSDNLLGLLEHRCLYMDVQFLQRRHCSGVASSSSVATQPALQQLRLVDCFEMDRTLRLDFAFKIATFSTASSRERLVLRMKSRSNLPNSSTLRLEPFSQDYLSPSFEVAAENLWNMPRKRFAIHQFSV